MASISNAYPGSMGLPVASISSTDAGYLGVVATAIPVILIGYILNLHQNLGKLAERLGREVKLGGIFSAPTQPLGEQEIQARISSYGSLILLALLLFSGIVLPSAAEFLALRALATNHLSSFARAVTLVGTTGAGLVLVLPLLGETIRLVVRGYRAGGESRSGPPGS